MCVITTADTEHPCHLRQFLQLRFVLQWTSLGLRISHQQCSTVYRPFHLASFICHMLRRLRHCCVCQTFVPFLLSPIPLCGCPSICLLVHQLTASWAVSKLFNLYFVLFFVCLSSLARLFSWYKKFVLPLLRVYYSQIFGETSDSGFAYTIAMTDRSLSSEYSNSCFRKGQP